LGKPRLGEIKRLRRAKKKWNSALKEIQKTKKRE